MTGFLYFLLGALLVISAQIAMSLFRRYRNPYRWKCKQCGFKIATQNRLTYEISVSSHNHVSLKEYK